VEETVIVSTFAGSEPERFIASTLSISGLYFGAGLAHPIIKEEIEASAMNPKIRIKIFMETPQSKVKLWKRPEFEHLAQLQTETIVKTRIENKSILKNRVKSYQLPHFLALIANPIASTSPFALAN